MKQFLIILILTTIFCTAKAQDNQVPYTLDDRDRMIRLEEKAEALSNEMNIRFAAMNDRFAAMDNKIEAQSRSISELKSTQNWQFATLLGALFIMFGFIIWDRRTAITPVSRRTKRLEEAMIEFAKNNADFREILKKASIL